MATARRKDGIPLPGGVRRAGIPRPRVDDPQVQAAFDSLIEQVESLMGSRGDPRDSAVTWRNLQSTGAVDGQLRAPRPEGMPDIVPSPAPEPDEPEPAAPTDPVAIGDVAIARIHLRADDEPAAGNRPTGDAEIDFLTRELELSAANGNGWTAAEPPAQPAVEYDVLGLPAGFAFDADTLEVAGRTDQAGTYPLTFVARYDDGRPEDRTTFDLVIS